MIRFVSCVLLPLLLIVDCSEVSPASDSQPEISFFFPPARYQFQPGEEKRFSFHASNSPNPPILWQSPRAAWLFWQVVLEIDSMEVSRWSADWITDADGVINATVSIPYLGDHPGRHVAVVSLLPGTVTIRECRNVSVSVGCPKRPVGEDDAPAFDALEFFV